MTGTALAALAVGLAMPLPHLSPVPVPEAMAGPGLSLPGLRQLKRRVLGGQRTDGRGRHQPPTETGQAVGQAAPGTPADSAAAEAEAPPLPTPDPRRLERMRAGNLRIAPPTPPTALAVPAPGQRAAAPSVAVSEAEAAAAPDQLPELPTPDPRRLERMRTGAVALAPTTPRAEVAEAAPVGPTAPAIAAPAPELAAAPPDETPEPPTRNPRRLSRRVAVALPGIGSGKALRPQLRPTEPAPAPGPGPGPTQQPEILPPSQLPGEAWSADFIARAENECRDLLANVAIESQTVAAFREGQCGAPTARLLTSISASPRVELRPAATLSCKMVAALALWFRDDVQPLAKKLFGSEVKALPNMSSYVCRNRYGDNDARISEHAFANALDIAGFELADGRKVMVLEGWHDPEGGKSEFLRSMHHTACTRFGTVLGPDANEAHRNHLHVDMAPRRQSNYCR